MIISELIDKLSKFPGDAQIRSIDASGEPLPIYDVDWDWDWDDVKKIDIKLDTAHISVGD